MSQILPWFKVVTPHWDIQQGILDESVFAANLAEVAAGEGKEVYNNPEVFFSKTYFTEGLKNIARQVVKGLNGEEDAENRVISLQTGFGGGKTHALISLYHLARWGKRTATNPYTDELVRYTGAPKFDSANVAVFTNATNDPTQGRKVDGLHIRTLWGELAYQLGGKAGYEIVRLNDEHRTAPKGLFKKLLEMAQPSLILLDELADYCVSASGEVVGASTLADQTISFIQELSEAVAGTNHCVMVATLPASVVEVATSPNASQILVSLTNRLSRVGKDTKPVSEEEIFEVIRRRLFEDLGSSEERERVISAYLQLYQNLSDELPSHASKSSYKELMRKAYPFHPELIDIFRTRWASHHDFQRTRGVLRLLASIVSDLWRRQGSLAGSMGLVQTAHVNFSNLDALSSQLKKLYGNGWDAVISADVSGSSSNAFKIDQEKKEYGAHQLTQGIASTILLGSFGSAGANKGLSVDEIKLAILAPDGFNHNSVNGALDVMEGHAHYLYNSSIGTTTKRYWYHTKPNHNILVNQAKSDVKETEVHAEILRRISDKTARVQGFNVLVDPAFDIPEQTRPTLVILHPQYNANPDNINGKTRPIIKQLSTKRGNADRVFRNTMLFLVCSEIGYPQLKSDVTDYLARLRIMEDYKSQLEQDQKNDIRKEQDDYNLLADKSLVTAYSIVAKQVKDDIEKIILRQFKDSLDLQINQNIIQQLKDEMLLLDAVGMNLLRQKNLLPTLEKPLKTKDVYEAFIRFDNFPMVTGVSAVQQSLLRYCQNKEIGIASGDGKVFSTVFLGEVVPFFDVTDETYYLVDKSLYQPLPAGGTYPPAPQDAPNPPAVQEGEPQTQAQALGDDAPKVLKSITISGKVSMEHYSQVFSSFVLPLAQQNVEIEIRIKGKSTQANPITASAQSYKIAKESARQLGLKFEEE